MLIGILEQIVLPIKNILTIVILYLDKPKLKMVILTMEQNIVPIRQCLGHCALVYSKT
jgi:hypothetical protein